MKVAPKTKRILLLSGVALLAVFLLLVIANSIIAHYVKPRLISYLKETVHQRSNQLYTLDFDRIRLNLIQGSAKISAVKLQADTTVFAALRHQEGTPSMIVDLSSQDLEISGVDIIQLLRHRKLDIELVRIEQPEILLLNYSAQEDSTATSRPFDPFRLIAPRFVSLGIAHIRITDGILHYKKKGAGHGPALHFEDFSLETDGLYIDSLSSRDTTRSFYSDDLRLYLKEFKYRLPDSLYTLHLASLAFSSREARLSLDSIQLQPRHAEMEFHRIAGAEIDHTSLKTGRITVSNFDIRNLLLGNELKAEAVHIENARLVNFLYNFKQDDRPYQQIPHLAFKHARLRVDLRKLTIENSVAIYRERPAGRRETGRVTFKNLHAVITNISNLPERISSHPVIQADVSTSLMDVGTLKVKFGFHMDRDDGYFTVDGSLGRMPIEAVNPMLEAVANMKIKRGTLQELLFSFKGDSTASRGTMKFRYNNLNVELLSKDDSEGNMKVASALTNLLLLNSNNPPPEGPLRTGLISFTRLKNKSIFNYLWKSLLTGFKSSVGISAEKETQLREMAESFKDRRQRREDRKRQRQERRAQRRADRQSGD